MKAEKTKSKKRWVYYLVLAIGVLLLVAATVLTVYFVTEDVPTVEAPPVDDNPPSIIDPDEPDDPNKPDDSGNSGKPDDTDGPSKPSGGETVRFISPLASGSYSVWNDIYVNATMKGVAYRHKAVDITSEVGETVMAMADGVVEKIIYNEITGNEIVVLHDDNIRTIYRFVEPAAGIGVGTQVKQGDKIAEVAEPYGIEEADGVHLHLEMTLAGEPIDPTEYLIPTLGEK